MSSTESYYTDKYKIMFSRSEITMDINFYGTPNIPALQMGKAFVMRFNDAWASEQFEKISDVLFPLYCEDVEVARNSVSAEGQYNNCSTVNTYFEYHPEIGVCADSAKEIVMTMNPAHQEETD